MKKFFLSLILLASVLFTYSQIDTTEVEIKKYVAWVSPSNATHVYGLMFNFYPRNEIEKFQNFPKIYGTEINLNPLGLFLPFILTIHSFDPKTHEPPYEDIKTIDIKTFKRINGIQIGLVNMEKSVINGLDINAAGSFDSKTNGLTISAVMNKHYIVNGITIAPIGNHDSKCTGLQIALFNSCKDLKGIQIGLWNKNQKRSLPIVNWSFH